MARGQNARGDPRCTAGQLEQADRVTDLRARPADAARELFLGDAEICEQLLVRRRLFEGVELRSMQVLEQRVAEQKVLIRRVADDRRDRGEPGLASWARVRRSPMISSYVPSHDVAGDDNGLEHAEFAHAVDELREIGSASKNWVRGCRGGSGRSHEGRSAARRGCARHLDEVFRLVRRGRGAREEHVHRGGASRGGRAGGDERAEASTEGRRLVRGAPRSAPWPVIGAAGPFAAISPAASR